MTVDEINRESERYELRNSKSRLPAEHFKERIQDFVRKLDRLQAPLPMDSGRFFTRKLQETK